MYQPGSPFAQTLLRPGANSDLLVGLCESGSPLRTGSSTSTVAPTGKPSLDKGVEKLGGKSQSQKCPGRDVGKAKGRQRKLNPVDYICIEGENTRVLS